MTKIECTKCGELIESTATTFVAPYVCDDCVEASEFQNLISPDTHEDKKGEASTLCDTATVEATTLLIADLEKQVELGDDALKVANDLIDDLSRQIAEKDTVITLTRSEAEFFANLAATRKGELRKILFDIVLTSRANTIQAEMIEERDEEIAKLNDALVYWQKEARSARRRYIDQRLENDVLTRRGFWARLVNKGA